jgi:hypothetical protein
MSDPWEDEGFGGEDDWEASESLEAGGEDDEDEIELGEVDDQLELDDDQLDAEL